MLLTAYMVYERMTAARSAQGLVLGTRIDFDKKLIDDRWPPTK